MMEHTDLWLILICLFLVCSSRAMGVSWVIFFKKVNTIKNSHSGPGKVNKVYKYELASRKKYMTAVITES